MKMETEWESLSKKQKARAVAKGIVMVVGAVSAGTFMVIGTKSIIPMTSLSRFNRAQVVIASTLLAGGLGEIAAKQAGMSFESVVTPIERAVEALKALKSEPIQKSEGEIVETAK